MNASTIARVDRVLQTMQGAVEGAQYVCVLSLEGKTLYVMFSLFAVAAAVFAFVCENSGLVIGAEMICNSQQRVHCCMTSPAG